MRRLVILAALLFPTSASAGFLQSATRADRDFNRAFGPGLQVTCRARGTTATCDDRAYGVWVIGVAASWVTWRDRIVQSHHRLLVEAGHAVL